MKQWFKSALILIGACIPLVICVSSLLSTPTGLNNIPTADVVGERTIVLQSFSHFGHRQRPGHWLGFKMNPFIRNVEIGMDRRVGPSPSGANLFQVKYKLDLKDPLPDLGVGVANMVFTRHGRRLSGQPYPYFAWTKDFKYFRGTAGAGFQANNEGAFIGLDKTIFKKLTLRTDALQVNNGKDLLGSLGFLLELPFNFALESWYSASTDTQSEDYFLVKIDYSIKF